MCIFREILMEKDQNHIIWLWMMRTKYFGLNHMDIVWILKETNTRKKSKSHFLALVKVDDGFFRFCLKTGVTDKRVCAKCSHQLGSSLPCLILLTRLIYYYVTANCLLRGWGRCLKVTMQTCAAKNFR